LRNIEFEDVAVRRTFLRHTKAQELNEQVIASYLLSYLPATLYHDWQRLPGITSHDLFDNTAPLELEIGCGSAEFLCSLAEKAPTTNFVGIDISARSLRKAVETAFELGLQNIKFINADFHLMYPLLRPDSLSAVYLHFPDPHLKARCQKRRLFNETFLNALSVALVNDDLLSVMTDVEAFFRAMLQLIEQDVRFRKVHPQRYLIGFEPAVKSHFQRLWELHGESVFRFEVCKIHATHS
jgi:tRNA (guanine-N7-)-methyltransferase